MNRKEAEKLYRESFARWAKLSEEYQGIYGTKDLDSSRIDLSEELIRLKEETSRLFRISSGIPIQ